MRDTDNIRKLAALKPDFIGFILYPGSKRYLGDEFVLETEIPGTIQRVGVFVNALMNEVIHWVNRLKLHYVQLHGTEPVEYCRELSEMKIGIIKTFAIDSHFDFSILEAYNSYCNYFLLETKSNLHGGSGQKFDWNVLKDCHSERPVILSGGIGPEDIEALHQLNKKFPLFAVDINSRFELEPGLKDINRVKQFIRALKKNNSKS